MKEKLFIIVIQLLFIIIVLSACSSSIHKANINAIELNRDKKFKIGIVKVAGRIPSTYAIFSKDKVERKNLILEKIPIDKICDTLTNTYGLKIDSEIDKTVKIAMETNFESTGKIGSRGFSNSTHISPICKNPFWGDTKYLEKNLEGENSVINITYFYGGKKTVPWKNQMSANYEISVMSNGNILLQHKAEIAAFDIPKKRFRTDEEAIWNILMSHVEKIHDALVRDIAHDR